MSVDHDTVATVSLDRLVDPSLCARIGLAATAPLYDAIVGMTVREAATMLREEIALKQAIDGFSRGSVTSYSINGRTVTSTPDALDRVARGLESLLAFSNGGGPLPLGVRL